MIDKNYSNLFRFSLYQKNVLFGEKMLDANTFNPITRYAIDIRGILPQAITRFQKVLSKKNYDTLIHEYDNYSKGNIHKYNPKPVRHEIENKVIKGVECKLGFYINENPIVERDFFVDGFNPISRYSVDLTDAINETTNEIFDQIKKVDLQNMWDDYDLIHTKGLSINLIRELSPGKRAYLLRTLKRY